MSVYENDNLLMRMKTEIPNFDDEELLEYTKIIIPNIHSFFSNQRIDKLKRYSRVLQLGFKKIIVKP